MAHEIDDNRAFFVLKQAWHKKGTVLDRVPTFDEAIQLLTRGDQYLKLKLRPVIEGIVGDTDLTRSDVIFRSDGTEYNTVGSDFELLQPSEAFKPQRGLFDSGLVQLESGALLHNGASAFLMSKIVNNGIADIVKGDSVKANLLMATGFDGRMRNTTIDCIERVVCQNTLSVALNEKNRGIDFKFKHTKNIRHKLDNAEMVIKGRLEAFQKQVEAYRYLASKKVTEKQAQEYIGSVFLTIEELKGEKDISAKKANTVSHVIDLLDNQKGLDLVPAIRGTAWQAYNAVSDYVTHDYGRNEDSRNYARFFGESAKINDKALELALNLN